MRPEDIGTAFARRFGRPPRVLARAPGRVNLIGEHTDYNEGFVLPLAVDRYTFVAADRHDAPSVAAYSTNLRSSTVFGLPVKRRPRRGRTGWVDYLRGVVWALDNNNMAQAPGAQLLIASDVPIGSGLSSSAALEVASAIAFHALGGISMSGVELALLCQRAEAEFVGVRCGIMDQFAAVFGRADHAIFLDCRDLGYRYVRLPSDFSLVVTDSMIRRELGSTYYNERRAQCSEGVRLLSQKLRNVRALRDVTPEDLDEHEAALPEVVRRRCRHVVSENRRVEAAVAALECSDMRRFGELMVEAHESLRDSYEVSLPELDLLVQATLAAGAVGARLTGAGFGGCTVSLVRDETVDSVVAAVSETYEKATGIRPASYVCRAAAGARLVA